MRFTNKLRVKVKLTSEAWKMAQNTVIIITLIMVVMKKVGTHADESIWDMAAAMAKHTAIPAIGT